MGTGRQLPGAAFPIPRPPAPADMRHLPRPCLPQVFGFFATIVFAIDFYLIFNDVAKFLKQGDSAHETTADKAEGGWPPCGFHQRTGLVTWNGRCGDPALPWGHLASLRLE